MHDAHETVRMDDEKSKYFWKLSSIDNGFMRIDCNESPERRL